MKIKLYPKDLLEAAWRKDKKMYADGDAMVQPHCLRCGSPLSRHLMVNAFSRYADVQICKVCGMDEALRDVSHTPPPLPCGVGCCQARTAEEKSRKVHLLSGAKLHFFRSVQAHLQASNAAHRTHRQRTCLFPFRLRWIPLVDNLAQ